MAGPAGSATRGLVRGIWPRRRALAALGAVLGLPATVAAAPKTPANARPQANARPPQGRGPAPVWPRSSVESWQSEWPNTPMLPRLFDPLDVFDTPEGKDGVKPLPRCDFLSARDTEGVIGNAEPVVSLSPGLVDDGGRAYPLSVLLWHHVVHDDGGWFPIGVSFAPLSCAFHAFDRRIPGLAQPLRFGSVGKARFADPLLYDIGTESWWQHLPLRSIAGHLAGTELTRLPCRLESLGSFRARAPEGSVLFPEPTDLPDGYQPNYGRTPYGGYEGLAGPVAMGRPHTGPLPPFSRLVVVGQRALPLDLLRLRRRIDSRGLRFEYVDGVASAVDQEVLTQSADRGSAVVTDLSMPKPREAIHTHLYAFAFPAFFPDGEIIAA